MALQAIVRRSAAVRPATSGLRSFAFGPPTKVGRRTFLLFEGRVFFFVAVFTWFRGIRVWRCELNALMVFHSHRLRRTGQEEGQTTMQSVNEFLDRSAQMLFLTEIARGFWLTAEVMTKPKVGARSARSPRSRSELTREGGGVSRLPPGRSLSITRSKKAL